VFLLSTNQINLCAIKVMKVFSSIACLFLRYLIDVFVNS